MSLAALSWAFAQKELSTAQKFVLVAIADAANYDGFCWPRQKHIAEKCNLGRQSINECIRALEKSGHLLVRRRFKKGGGKTSSIYMLNLPDLPLKGAFIAGDEIYLGGGNVVQSDIAMSARATTYVAESDNAMSSTPTTKKNPKSSNRKTNQTAAARLDVFALPEFIPQENWDRFVDHRKKIRKPMTDHAKDLMVKRLRSFHDAGWKLADLLDEAVRKGWQDVYISDAGPVKRVALDPLGGDAWSAALEMFFNGGTTPDGYGGTKKIKPGSWASKLGPPPGAPGCRVPIELLKRFTKC